LVDCSTHVSFAAQNNTARARLRRRNAGFVRRNALIRHYAEGSDTTNAGTCPPPDVTLASPVALSRVR